MTSKGTGIADSELLMDPGNQRYIDSNNPYNTRGTKYAPTQDFATDSLNSSTTIPINSNTTENIIVTQANITQNNVDVTSGGNEVLINNNG